VVLGVYGAARAPTEPRGYQQAPAAATAIVLAVNGGDDLTRGRRMLFGLENVTYTRAGRRLVSDLNVRLEVRTTALVGSSGAGKSTLLRLLNRLADPDSATITYRGQDVRDYDVLELPRDRARPADPGTTTRHRLRERRLPPPL
jgi:ABC-type multidrug transport system fused ATPase/permease subunit